MPFQTDLSVPPYYNTYQASNDYYRVVNKTGVSLQVRELAEVQEMFAAQVERFGDNIFKPGTIVSGCNFAFLNPYPYVKLLDQDVFGNPVTPSAYVNNAILNVTTGLRAHAVNFLDGFVSTDPNLKTLYLQYYNTGYSGNVSTFSAGDTLLVYDPLRNGLENVVIASGGTGFANGSNMFAVSAIAITPTTGTIANGQFISNGLGANLEVVSVDSLTLANSGQVILSLAPRSADLANSSLSSVAWTVANGQPITNSGNTATATVAAVIGTGYQGLAITNSLGAITSILTLNKGVGYTSVPWITTQSANNSGGYSGLVLNPLNYIAQIQVASTTGAVGNGYGFSVNEGIVYLRGAFLQVPSQTVVVSSYDVLPDNVSVCFTATENIVTADVDPTLNDPAAGPNNGAPGADRLQVVPQLIVVDTQTASANSLTTPLVEWNAGNPFIQRNQTVYSTIGASMAQQVVDQSGDFYVDPFLVTTTSDTNGNSSVFDVVVDSGSAYIAGYKVTTQTSFTMSSPIQTGSIVQPFNLNLNYQNYLVVGNVGGTFQYNTGDQVQLYSLVKGFGSNSLLVKSGNLTPQGVQLGTAQVRNLQLLSGTPGTNSAQYGLYLFNVNMNAGGNFSNVMSVAYSGNNHGIADVVQTFNPTTNSNGTQLVGTSLSSLVFRNPYLTILNSNQTSYQFSSLDQTVTIANSGILTKSLSTTNWTYPWSGAALTASQLAELYLTPTTVDLVSSTNASGSWLANTATANLIANTSTAALTNFVAGDWVYLLGNTTQIDLHQIMQVVNNTFLVLDSVPTIANTSAVLTRCFPRNLPIPMNRAGISANVSSNGTVLTINVGFPIAQATSEPMVLGVPILISNSAPTPKTVNRNSTVMIVAANNAGNTVGPWCLGVPDAFRLRGVYLGTNSTNVSLTGTNYYSQFSINAGHTTDYCGLSYLTLNPGASNPIVSSSFVIAVFDWFSPTGTGYYATPSYTQTSNVAQLLINDAGPLSSLTTSASTWEVPDFFGDQGNEVDLLNCIDFRPYAQNTSTPGSNSTNCPVNPANTKTFSTTEKLFPMPGSTFATNLNFFVPRVDAVFVSSNGLIYDQQGLNSSNTGNLTLIPTPPGNMKVADVYVPPYPNLPNTVSTALSQLINTRVLNTKYSSARANVHGISYLSSISQDAAKVYTNQDIAELDTRLTNVEYYVSLNTLETSVQSLVIPSSSDPSVNRYQFGFFADDFKTPTLSDISYPGYSAQIENGDLVPAKLEWEVYVGDAFAGAQPYTQAPIVTQLNATIGTLADPTTTPQCAVALANTVAYQLVYRNASDGSNRLALQDGSVDVVTVTLADSQHMSAEAVAAANAVGLDSSTSGNLGSGQVTLFFYAYDNPVEFQILQGNTVVVDSSSAVALNANDITNLTTGTILHQWFNDRTSTFMKAFQAQSGNFVEYAGKVVWNYAGTGNNKMSIVTTNGVGTQNGWRWVLSYPINGATAGCVPPPPPITTCPPGYQYTTSCGGCVLIPPPPPPPPPPPTPTPKPKPKPAPAPAPTPVPPNPATTIVPIFFMSGSGIGIRYETQAWVNGFIATGVITQTPWTWLGVSGIYEQVGGFGAGA